MGTFTEGKSIIEQTKDSLSATLSAADNKLGRKFQKNDAEGQKKFYE